LPAESVKLVSLTDPQASKDPLSEDDSKSDPLEIVFVRSSATHDGRYANNGWLQETPDPLTKLTWDNVAIFSPATARALGVEDEMLVRLEFAGRSVEMPAYILPGQASGSVTVALGYGRTAAGHVGGHKELGVAPVGVNVYPLRQSGTPFFASGVKVTRTAASYTLAVTQDHHAIDTIGRKGTQQRIGELIREATLDEYRQHPDFAQHMVHHEPLVSLFDEHPYDGHRWGMAIDLSRCIGCNACTVACQAENNVPIVGKKQVAKGREMHWLRIDRYFRGETDEPDVSHQPVACHHCENAPCEQVCPVMATVHSSEGLNDMVYNRCVGTRYCANNCPYKVRRFNFFYYHQDLDKPENAVLKMVQNPEVTIRSRGVMEKCTYCVQRIQKARTATNNADRPMRDGDVKSACQQACPTQAIVFGDLNDRESAVAKAHAANRAYGMLAELNVKPRTVYLAKLRNPNPELESGTGHA
jgi:Fe-S-cluster-containing dehydrogenase component